MRFGLPGHSSGRSLQTHFHFRTLQCAVFRKWQTITREHTAQHMQGRCFTVSLGVVVLALGGVLDSLEQTLNRTEHFLLSVLGWDVQAVAQQHSCCQILYSFWILTVVPLSFQGHDGHGYVMSKYILVFLRNFYIETKDL